MGSILTTPSRNIYRKTGSGNRMKISEKNTWRRGVDYGIQQARASVAEANQMMTGEQPPSAQVEVGDSMNIWGKASSKLAGRKGRYIKRKAR